MAGLLHPDQALLDFSALLALDPTDADPSLTAGRRSEKLRKVGILTVAPQLQGSSWPACFLVTRCSMPQEHSRMYSMGDSQSVTHGNRWRNVALRLDRQVPAVKISLKFGAIAAATEFRLG